MPAKCSISKCLKSLGELHGSSGLDIHDIRSRDKHKNPKPKAIFNSNFKRRSDASTALKKISLKFQADNSTKVELLIYNRHKINFVKDKRDPSIKDPDDLTIYSEKMQRLITSSVNPFINIIDQQIIQCANHEEKII